MARSTALSLPPFRARISPSCASTFLWRFAIVSAKSPPEGWLCGCEDCELAFTSPVSAGFPSVWLLATIVFFPFVSRLLIKKGRIPLLEVHDPFLLVSVELRGVSRKNVQEDRI